MATAPFPFPLHHPPPTGNWIVLPVICNETFAHLPILPLSLGFLLLNYDFIIKFTPFILHNFTAM